MTALRPILLDHMARDLYRAIPTMPKPARRVAYSMIDIIKRDAVNRRPMGDHDIQNPKRFLREQLERFEEAIQSDPRKETSNG